MKMLSNVLIGVTVLMAAFGSAVDAFATIKKGGAKDGGDGGVAIISDLDGTPLPISDLPISDMAIGTETDAQEECSVGRHRGGSGFYRIFYYPTWPDEPNRTPNGEALQGLTVEQCKQRCAEMGPRKDGKILESPKLCHYFSWFPPRPNGPRPTATSFCFRHQQIHGDIGPTWQIDNPSISPTNASPNPVISGHKTCTVPPDCLTSEGRMDANGNDVDDCVDERRRMKMEGAQPQAI